MSRTDDFLAAAAFDQAFSFDIEHDPKMDRHKPGFMPLGCGFATEGLTFFEKDLGEIEKIVNELFPDDYVEAIAYNAKYDLQCLRACGILTKYAYPKKLVDPMVAVNLLEDNRRPNEMGLRYAVWDQFNYEMTPFDIAWSCGPHSPEFAAYACDDARYEWMLWKALKPGLEDQGLLPLFEKILMPVTKVFADMELVGIKWDAERVRELLTGYQELRDQLEADVFAEIGELNLRSSQQLTRRLFGELGYSTDGLDTTPKGKVSVGAKSMDVLARKYPVCKKIRTYRTAVKIINTYIVPLTRAAGADKHGRIHPTFWIVSATGRTRSEKPNFQNIPAHLSEDFKGLSIRDNIIAEEGRKLIVADLSQIELRLVGHISQDPGFLKAYSDWQCTACNSTGTGGVILHECPKCGVAEDEDVITVCPTCKAEHVRTFWPKKGKKKVCPVCADDAVYDDVMVKAFWHGLDLHQMTCDSVGALKGNRDVGKRANFALVYCATAFKMNYEYPAFSVEQWERVIEGFFETYPRVREWHERMQRCLWGSRTCVDIFGRKRRILKKALEDSPKNALNMIVNFGPQSSACAMLELAMVKMRQHWVDSGDWLTTVFPTNMVHDEIVLEVADDEVDAVCEVVREKMEHVVQIAVPVRTDIKVVDRWGKAK